MAIALSPDQRASARRLSRMAMDVLECDRIWTGSMGEAATEAAVLRGVEIMIRSGEQDEALILERVLEIVCGGRLTSVLRQRSLQRSM